MKKEIFKNSILAMLNNTVADAGEIIEKAIEQGAIDLENEDENDYTTRKAFVHVILSSMANNWEPLTNTGKAEAKNLKHFVLV